MPDYILLYDAWAPCYRLMRTGGRVDRRTWAYAGALVALPPGCRRLAVGCWQVPEGFAVSANVNPQ